jgi:hypothetical protein
MSLEAMLDLETLGNGNNACILSIGAVLFDPKGDGIHSKFEVHVDPASCVAAGLQMDASTVMWWLDPERDAARNELTKHTRETLIAALGKTGAFLTGDRPVWGNGATFDNVILRSAYKAAGMACPWMFWNDRCYRTIKSLYPGVKLERVGVHHSAVDDAASQALHLQRIFKEQQK